MINSSQQIFVASGAFLGFLSVAAGAFGAHLLKHKLSLDDLNIFETAARYQMYHALALVLVGIALHFVQSKWLLGAGWLFLVGILIFSGSLYTLVFSGVRQWGMITPIGGFSFLAGWLCLFISSFR